MRILNNPKEKDLVSVFHNKILLTNQVSQSWIDIHLTEKSATHIISNISSNITCHWWVALVKCFMVTKPQGTSDMQLVMKKSLLTTKDKSSQIRYGQKLAELLTLGWVAKLINLSRLFLWLKIKNKPYILFSVSKLDIIKIPRSIFISLTSCTLLYNY